MDDAILVLNAGSSSLKFSIYVVAGRGLDVQARGQIEGLGRSCVHFKARDHHGQVMADMALAGTGEMGHGQAFLHLSEWIRTSFGGRFRPLAVGHRITHGGESFAAPALIDEEAMEKLERLIPLAPLHQPHNLAGIRAVMRLRPDLPQVGCFDTAFHRGRAGVTERFALPDEMFEAGVRRWGFHGLSYQSIAEQFRALAPAESRGRVIVAHLGSGASLCAMRDGRSVDTTMGFSTLDGLPMSTRCGSLDPGVLLHLARSGMSTDEIETLLYKGAGLLGMSGVSQDVRDLLGSNRPSAAAAMEFFVYRISREVGSLAAALNGLDALVFSAGIAENSPVVRQRVCSRLEWLGIGIDHEANFNGRGRISVPGTSPSVWVIPTDEEKVIATGTYKLIGSNGAMTPAARC